MTKFFLLFFASVLFCSVNCYSQQDIQYSMYTYNGLYLNPAYAGSHDALNATAVYRTQWVNVPGAPESASVAIHSPLQNDKLALGLIYTYDQIGVTKTNSVDASFAYRAPIGRNKDIRLCVGLAAGFENYYANFNNIALTDPNDQQFTGTQNRWLPDAQVGIYVYGHKFFAGAALSHIFSNNLTGLPYAFETSPLVAHQYYNVNVNAGYVLDISPKVKFLPSVLFKYVPVHAPFTFDFNATFVFIDRIWVGAAYRLNDSYNFMVSAYVTKSLRIGYAYDLTVSTLNSFTSGSHELLVGVDFAVLKGKLSSPKRVIYF